MIKILIISAMGFVLMGCQERSDESHSRYANSITEYYYLKKIHEDLQELIVIFRGEENDL